MAHLSRVAKSTNDWTLYDLEAYGIFVISQSKSEFFATNSNISLTLLVDAQTHYLEQFANTADSHHASNTITRTLLHLL